MLPDFEMRAIGVAMLFAACVSVPALADVKTGVDAWSRGDYTAAVREWEGPAAAGDADAMFNLGQAYRLGRGVPADIKRAEALYAGAAASGHLQAADTYGLLLFQDGRREAALPYVRDAARRGDARSQYLLGIAHFNGDLVEKDWTRAYALMTLANGAGLPQAAPAIVEMDGHIPLAQRQAGAGLAMDMRSEADAARASELAAFDLAAQSPPPSAEPAPVVGQPAPQTANATPRVPRPIPTVAVSPSVAAARDAIAEASRATGTESPAEAGASYARTAPQAEVVRVSAPVPEPVFSTTPVTVARLDPPPAPAPRAPVVAAASNGPWRIQLGAFSVTGNAERLWSQLSGRAELAGTQKLLVPSGRVMKLQAGGFASRSAADAACRSLRQSGQDCLVTDR